MEDGEDFTIIDTRNPQAWSQSDKRLPHAIRVVATHKAAFASKGMKENLARQECCSSLP